MSALLPTQAKWENAAYMSGEVGWAYSTLTQTDLPTKSQKWLEALTFSAGRCEVSADRHTLSRGDGTSTPSPKFRDTPLALVPGPPPWKRDWGKKQEQYSRKILPDGEVEAITPNTKLLALLLPLPSALNYQALCSIYIFVMFFLHSLWTRLGHIS